MTTPASVPCRALARSLVMVAFGLLAVGCQMNRGTSPAEAGLNARDIVDPIAQAEAEELNPMDQLAVMAERFREERKKKLEDQSKKEGGVAVTKPNRNILCLSGGGSFGAYTAGVLVGWTERGDRPQFDVVTGISTGALISPFAFIGPKYDYKIKELYTAVVNKDLYRIRPLQALFGEAFADTRRFAKRVDEAISPEVIADIAEAHRQGRRLYVGTTEEEGKQFVIWDLSALAARNAPGDRELIVKILLGSSAPPGFFPASKIDVSVGGQCYVERHADGGVSQSLFFRPPYVPPDERSDVAARDLAGAKVYVILAGKLYADPEVIRPRALTQASKSVSTLIYAQTRGDLQRLYTVCLLTGMDYFVTSIPLEYPAPTSSSEFKPDVLIPMFEEGRRVVQSAKPWRTLPPGAGPGEAVLTRAGVCLTYQPRGPAQPVHPRKGLFERMTTPPVTDRGALPILPAEGAVK